MKEKHGNPNLLAPSAGNKTKKFLLSATSNIL